ncbi:MAG: Hsp20/alpha crystallin family protein [Chloroflexota bacterium]
MRYRRVGYRMAVVLAAQQPRALGTHWHGSSLSVAYEDTAWRPPVDIVETPTAVVVTVELAGIDQDAVDVLLYEDAIVIEGERRTPQLGEALYHAAEIRQGRFRVQVPLPAMVSSRGVQAHYERGLLTITLRKPPAARTPHHLRESTRLGGSH